MGQARARGTYEERRAAAEQSAPDRDAVVAWQIHFILSSMTKGFTKKPNQLTYSQVADRIVKWKGL